MKKLIIVVTIAITTIVYSQENNRFEFSVSYGLAYSNFFGYRAKIPDGITVPVPELDIRTTDFGSVFELNLDYALPKNKFIGIGFARQQHSRNIDDSVIVSNSELVLTNYRAIDQNQFYDIHFRKEFKNRFHLTLGLFYFFIYSNDFNFQFNGSNLIYELKNDKQRADNIGLSLALDYYIPIKDYLEIGLRGKVYYSFAGVETVSLSPTLKLNF